MRGQSTFAPLQKLVDSRSTFTRNRIESTGVRVDELSTVSTKYLLYFFLYCTYWYFETHIIVILYEVHKMLFEQYIEVDKYSTCPICLMSNQNEVSHFSTAFVYKIR